MNKSNLGISETLAKVLIYLFPFLGGILFLIFDYQNRSIRLHALQSILFGAFWIVGIVVLYWLSLIPFLGILFIILQWILNIGCVIITLALIVRAAQGEILKLPWIYGCAYRVASR